MNVQTPNMLAGLVLAAAATTTLAQPAPVATNLLAMRGELIAAVEAMPQDRLRAYFLNCSNESAQQLLPLAEAVTCAIAWDTLLRREYHGDIEALLSWWRAHRRAGLTLP